MILTFGDNKIPDVDFTAVLSPHMWWRSTFSCKRRILHWSWDDHVDQSNGAEDVITWRCPYQNEVTQEPFHLASAPHWRENSSDK